GTSVTVSGANSYPSDPFDTSTLTPGTYHWIAVYSGDVNYFANTTKCGDTNEVSVVTMDTPVVNTSTRTAVSAGTAVTDTATITGGFNPGGTITFDLFGPTDVNCDNAAMYTSSPVPVSGDGTYTSTPPFPVPGPGTYRWVATYSGDANNNRVFTTCGDPNETVQVSAISTTASPSVPVGGSVFDTATLTLATTPPGGLPTAITFALFGPANATCTGAPAFASKTPTTGSGVYKSATFVPTVAGTYRWIAVYSGDRYNAGASTACGDAGETVVVTAVTPTLTTQASGAVPAGGVLTDNATLAKGVNPTGTIVFQLFGPGTTTCTGAPLATSNVTVAGNGPYVSPPFTTTVAGAYRWLASYSGDPGNTAVSAPCTDPAEGVTVGLAMPKLTTQASAATPVGGTISDTANLTGGFSPSGSIGFKVFGPNDTTCANPPAFNQNVSVAGAGAYTGGPFTPAAAGTYRFVANYGGDPSNAAVATTCADPAESVNVTRFPTTISTQASAPVGVGGSVSDTATLTAGAAPVSGTLTFNFYGPTDPTCVRPPLFTSVKTATAGGGVPSSAFSPQAAGTYLAVAAYSGDANHNPAGTKCGDSGESVVVAPATITLATQSSPAVPVGNAISDTATISGGFHPGGTLTFSLYGSGNAACTGSALFTSTKGVAGDSSYKSDAFAPPAIGTYRWVVSYSGDAANASAVAQCADPAESTVVGPGAAGITTQASGATTLGSTISDTAHLSGFKPTGTITFQVYGPNNTSCAGSPASTSSKTVNGAGAYTSDPFTPTAVGRYTFTASYGGDANNSPAGPTACADPAETVQVTPAVTAKPPSASGPALTVAPPLGPNGLVALVHGSGFAAGAVVTLEWLPGIGTATVTAGPDGAFNVGMLVLYHDEVG
ncbi:MAG: hypothetical protein M3N98_07825, partial [Actinomycetota bacterium]|nr:hypothetical protein [Actinomycetota bacterium]